jgi:hypothetical protein
MKKQREDQIIFNRYSQINRVSENLDDKKHEKITSNISNIKNNSR